MTTIEIKLQNGHEVKARYSFLARYCQDNLYFPKDTETPADDETITFTETGEERRVTKINAHNFIF